MGTAVKAIAPDALDTCRFLSVAEVSKLLKVSRTSLYALVSQKQNPIPSVRIGKSRRFPFDKLRVWMENLER